MTAAHETVLYDVHDFKVYALLTDATGASPTYGAAVDVPGIAEVGLDPNLVTKELKGDARIIAKKGRVDRFNLKATYGKLSLDVLGVILGGQVFDLGSGSSEEARWDLSSPAPLSTFKAEFKVDDLDIGLATVHVILYKCQLTGGTLFGQKSDDFGQPSMDLEGIQPDGTAPMIRVRLLEAATDLDA
jgi:hypothetical protein